MNEHLSLQQIREEFKSHLDKWQQMTETHPPAQVLASIQAWGFQLEKDIQIRLKLFDNDFLEYTLQGEYARSVMESFDDIAQLMKTHKTFIDIAKGNDLPIIFQKIKKYYLQYFVPLVNIFARLQNDYIAVATKTIIDKSAVIEKIEEHLKELKKEKQQIKSRLFEFNRKEKYNKLAAEIKRQELRKQLIRLNVHHHKLNLYYFNHDRPSELKDIKEQVDKLRWKLHILEKEIVNGQ